jgi:hypothetical protein
MGTEQQVEKLCVQYIHTYVHCAIVQTTLSKSSQNGTFNKYSVRRKIAANGEQMLVSNRNRFKVPRNNLTHTNYNKSAGTLDIILSSIVVTLHCEFPYLSSNNLLPKE